MSEADNGRAVADGVIGIVRRAFPDVGVEVIPAAEGRWCTTVLFLPSNPDGVSVDLYVNSDSSVDMSVGPIHVFDMYPSVGSDEEQTEFIAATILEYAASGVTSRLHRYRRGRFKPWVGRDEVLGSKQVLRPAHDVPQEVMTLLRRQGSGWHVGEHLRLDGAISFARVMNPADGDADATTAGPKTWASIAGESVDATTSWNDVGPLSDAEPPEQSVIHPKNARILGAHTTTPDACYFMTWVGYGDVREEFHRAPGVTISPYSRQMLILQGSVSDGAQSPVDAGGRQSGSPLWWVPRDGAWTVGNDIYSTCVYVAAREEVIAEILATEDLEAYRATADMWIVGEEFADD